MAAVNTESRSGETVGYVAGACASVLSSAADWREGVLNVQGAKSATLWV